MMTPELLGEAAVGLLILTGLMFALCVGCVVADYVLPHIKLLRRWVDSLPQWDDEDTN
jgi:hypothetical protein